MKEIIATQKAPGAIGPYSQGVAAGGFVFTSGQLPMDPETGAMAPPEIEVQTRQVLRNLQAVLEAGGAGLEDVVKTTVYLKDMEDFARMNSVYQEFFTGTFPARSAFQVARLPKDALVEVEAVALRR